MTEQNLTVQEAVDLLLMSQSSVYSWIEKGKLKTIDSPTGKLIVISNNEIETIREFNLKSRRNKVSKQSAQVSGNLQDSPIIEVEYSKNDEVLLSSLPNSNSPAQTQTNHKTAETQSTQDFQPNDTVLNGDVNLYLVKQLEKYALDAGQFKQLEIIRKQEKDDLEHWKQEYYALKSEHIAALARLESAEIKLQATIEAKDIEISALKKQIDALMAQKPSATAPGATSDSQNNPQNSSGIVSSIKKFFTTP